MALPCLGPGVAEKLRPRLGGTTGHHPARLVHRTVPGGGVASPNCGPVGGDRGAGGLTEGVLQELAHAVDALEGYEADSKAAAPRPRPGPLQGLVLF